METFIGVYFKSGNKKVFLKSFEGTKESIVAKMKTSLIGYQFQGLIRSYEVGLCATSVNDTQTTFGGCYFIIEGKEKNEKFQLDTIWIENVKSESKKFPAASFYFIEAHRSKKIGNESAFEKCLVKIRKEYPNFKFEEI